MNLEKELQYFKDHQPELVEKYENKFLVIKDQKVVGAYDTEIKAYSESQKKFELGSFLIQQCLPGIGIFSQTYHSQAVFI